MNSVCAHPESTTLTTVTALTPRVVPQSLTSGDEDAADLCCALVETTIGRCHSCGGRVVAVEVLQHRNGQPLYASAPTALRPQTADRGAVR